MSFRRTNITFAKQARIFLCAATLCSLFFLYCSLGANESTEKPKINEDRLGWFREAKYGMYIHWGLYSIPGGCWKGRRYPGFGEYAKLAGDWNPAKYDPESWVLLAKQAGMKYIIITAKHHDGFALFKSAVSKFNMMDATPCRRDVISDFAQACAKHKMRLGFYYSQAQDWSESGGAGNTWDFGPDEAKDKSGSYDAYIKHKALPQVTELLTKYGPVSCIWFDTPVLMTPERGQVFADTVRKLQPVCLIDGRLGTDGDYITTDDNTVPHQKTETNSYWETPMTMNHTWGFRQDDQDWRSPFEILFKLVDVVSKGGNFLLNIGPDADGVVPEGCAANLRVAGEWLKINGEAIYGACPSPFGAEYGEFSARQRDRQGQPLFLSLSSKPSTVSKQFKSSARVRTPRPTCFAWKSKAIGWNSNSRALPGTRSHTDDHNPRCTPGA